VTRWLSDTEQQTWRSLLDMNRLLLGATDRQLQQDSGIPVAYYAILAVLSETPDRQMRMSALAEAVEGSQSRLSHAVSRLEDRGWVERRRCPSDGRGWFAVLTDEGAEVLRKAAPGHVAYVREILFDVLSPEQQESLREIATTVADKLRPSVVGAAPCPETV
jgi:DNA-binding MarR family transcriptional regulator